MSKRTVTRWAQRQYAGDVQPFPLWLRVILLTLAAVVILGKLVGWF